MRSPIMEHTTRISENSGFLSFGQNHSTMRLLASAEVYLEFFRGLPIRLRACNDYGDYTCMLPIRFQHAFARVLQTVGTQAAKETEWTFFGRRHGQLEEVAELVISELDAAIDNESLERWQTQAVRDRDMALSHIIFALALLRSSSQQAYLA